MGGATQVPRHPLNTSLYIILTMILHENMKPIEHVLLHPICVLSHLMCAFKHCNVKSSFIWYGLIMHFCDANHEITRMQQEEIQ